MLLTLQTLNISGPLPLFRIEDKNQDKTVLSEPSAESNPVILAFTNLANLLKKGPFAFALCSHVQCKALFYDMLPPLSDSPVIDNDGSKELSGNKYYFSKWHLICARMLNLNCLATCWTQVALMVCKRDILIALGVWLLQVHPDMTGLILWQCHQLFKEGWGFKIGCYPVPPCSPIHHS